MLKRVSLRDQEVLEFMMSFVADNYDANCDMGDEDEDAKWEHFYSNLWPRLQRGDIKFMEEE